MDAAAVVAWRVWAVAVLVADVSLLQILAQRGFGFEAEPYAVAAAVVLVANASLLFVTRRRGEPETRASTRWRLAAAVLALAVFAYGCWMRGARLADFPMDAIPDMHRVVAIGAGRLVRGEFPYVRVDVPWRTFMVYQPGMLLPFTVAAALGVDTRWTAVVASVAVPALWVGVFGGRRPAALLVVAPVALAWLLDPEQVAFPAQFHDAAWWPWVVGGSLCFLSGRWTAAGMLWGAAMASRQYAGGVVALFAYHLLWRTGWRPALAFTAAAALTAGALYLPFVAVDWRSVLVQPLRTYHDVMTLYVIPQRPEWIRSSMGWSSWLIALPRYYEWVLAVQLTAMGMIGVAAVRWATTRAAMVVCGGLVLLVFNFLHDWPVWYLHIAPLLLVATGALDAACTSLPARARSAADPG